MTEEEYKHKVLQILNPFLDKQDKTLTELARIAEGITPSDIVKIVGDKFKSIKKRNPFSEQVFSFPEPNPVDFDWRFTKETSENIAKVIGDNTSSIGCFGVPSVFSQLIKYSDTTLFDINSFLPNDFLSVKDKIVLVDLNNEQIEGFEFDLIIMDPPWYIDSYSNWLKQAINNIKLGAVIYTTKIPPLVRPEAITEWQNIINEFEGLIQKLKLELNVDYETPFFEHETFNALGLGYIGNWKTTQLHGFKLVSKKKLMINKIEQPKWKRYRFGNKVVSLLVNDNETNIVVKAPYSDGSYTLKSVSNRERIRRNVNFLSSRNKALVIKGTKKVDLFLQKLSINHDFNRSCDSSYQTEDVENLKIIHSIIGI